MSAYIVCLSCLYCWTHFHIKELVVRGGWIERLTCFFIHRYTALETTVKLLPYIAECFQEMREEENYRNDWDACNSLLRSIQSFQFIYTLNICCQIMGATKELCAKLQGMALQIKLGCLLGHFNIIITMIATCIRHTKGLVVDCLLYEIILFFFYFIEIYLSDDALF